MSIILRHSVDNLVTIRKHLDKYNKRFIGEWHRAKVVSCLRRKGLVCGAFAGDADGSC